MALKIVLILIALLSMGAVAYLLLQERGLTGKAREEKKATLHGHQSPPGGRDYRTYVMGKRERMIWTLQGMGGLFLLGMVFYQQVIFSALLTPLGLLYPRMKRKQRIKAQLDQLRGEFKDALYALSASLGAGRSVELALEEVVNDLQLQYPEEESLLVPEFQLIIRKLSMNETVEAAFQELASRSGVEDMENFADVFGICHRTGGNLVEVMKNTSKIIAEKIEFKQELELLLAQRKFEQRILAVIPVAMILLLKGTAGDYMAPVFTTITGRVVMTLSMVLTGLALWLGKKIMEIEV